MRISNTFEVEVPVWKTWSVKVDGPKAKEIVQMFNGVYAEYPAPAGYKYRSLEFPFQQQ